MRGRVCWGWRCRRAGGLFGEAGGPFGEAGGPLGRQGGGQLPLLLLVSTLSPDSGVTSFQDSSAKRPSPNPGSSAPWCELSGTRCPEEEPLPGWAATPPPQLQTLVQVSARATLHLGGGVAQAPRFKHQGGGGLGRWGAVPGNHPSHGAEPLSVQVPSLWRAKRFSAPPPSQSRGLGQPERGLEGEVGGAGRLRAHLCGANTLAAGAGRAGRHQCAPGLPRSAPGLRVPRPRLCAGREPAPPAPSPRGAGRGCGAGGTSDSALRARRLHGA